MGVKITGLTQLSADLRAVIDGVEDGTVDATKTLAEHLADAISKDTPYDTGALLSTVTADGFQVTVGGPRAPYAGVVEDREPFVRPNVEQLLREGVTLATETVRKAIR